MDSLKIILLLSILLAMAAWLAAGLVPQSKRSRFVAPPTRNIKYLRVTDYLPLPNKCDPHTCFMAIAWMHIECGYSKEGALSSSREFVESLNLQLKGIRELIEDYEDGALKPGKGKKLIEQWMDCYRRNNHEILRRYLSELKESMQTEEDGIPRVDPTSAVPDKYAQNAYPDSLWRERHVAERNRGICPDPAFIQSLEIPPKIAAWVEIEDTYGFLDDKHQVYHVSGSGY